MLRWTPLPLRRQEDHQGQFWYLAESTKLWLVTAKQILVSKFGGAVRYSRILSAIDDSDVSITRNNTTLRMRRDMVALENTLASYEVCFTNANKNPQGGNVYSTGFTQLEGNDVLILRPTTGR